MQEPTVEGLAKIEENLNRFSGLDAAYDAHQRGQHPGVGTIFPVVALIRVEAVVTGAGGVVDRSGRW